MLDGQSIHCDDQWATNQRNAASVYPPVNLYQYHDSQLTVNLSLSRTLGGDDFSFKLDKEICHDGGRLCSDAMELIHHHFTVQPLNLAVNACIPGALNGSVNLYLLGD